MLWGRTVSALSPSGATDTKAGTEPEISSLPPTQVCRAEIIYIINSYYSGKYMDKSVTGSPLTALKCILFTNNVIYVIKQLKLSNKVNHSIGGQ